MTDPGGGPATLTAELAGVTDEELRALVSQLGTDGAPHTVEDLVAMCPRLVTSPWLDDPTLAPPAAVDALRRFRAELDAGTRSWPWGSGPLEQLLGGLDRAFGLEAALSLARSPIVTASLSAPYMAAACNVVTDSMERHDVRDVARRQQVLMAAAEQEGVADADPVRAQAWLTWLDAAKAVLGEYGDHDVFTLAGTVKDRLLELADATGNSGMAIDCHFRYAAVLVAPYLPAGTSLDVLDRRMLRWQMRSDEAGVPDGSDGGEAIPSATEAFQRAADHLRAALACDAGSVNVGRVRQLLANVLLRSLVVDERTDSVQKSDPRLDEVAELAAAAAAELPAYDLPLKAEALLLLHGIGRPFDLTVLDNAWSKPVDDLSAQYGTLETARLLVSLGQLLAETEPELAVAMLSSIKQFERSVSEDARGVLLRVHRAALFGGLAAQRADALLEKLPEVDAEGVVTAALKFAEDREWTLTETVRVIAVAATDERLSPEDALRLLEFAPTLAPSFVDAHADGFGFHAASTTVDLAGRVYQITSEGSADSTEITGDPGPAFALLGQAMSHFAALDMADAALECIEIMRNALLLGGPGIAPLVVREVWPRAAEVEAMAGERALQSIAVLLHLSIGALLKEGADSETFLLALQLAKGHAFTTTLTNGTSFDPFGDDEAVGLLQEIMEQETVAGAAVEPDDPRDEVRLVQPYVGALEDAATTEPLRLLRGLQHRFDDLVERRLVSAGELGLSPEQLVRTLPSDTVLLVLYVAAFDEAQNLICTIVTQDTVSVTFHPIGASNEGYVIDPDAPPVRVAEMFTFSLRSGLQSDPGPRLVSREAGQMLDGAGMQVLGAAADVLIDLHAKGYRHLVVVPHGPLHATPIHLFGPVGTPLCDAWNVTYAPAPFAVAAGRTGRGPQRTGVAAFGIDFAGYPGGGFQLLPDAVIEAQAVAAAGGGTALVNGQVTRAAVAEALESARWVHLATHGTANASAPAFNSLVVWPDGTDGDDGRIATYELLSLDLRGLELVTMSACDTALGRYDMADNVRGIPSALMRLGVASVVGTLWPVETATSAAFFTALYKGLGGGMRVGDAFVAAQQEVRASHKAYRDWGAFVLSGSW